MKKNHFWRAFVLKAFCLNTYLEFNVFLYGCYSRFICCADGNFLCTKLEIIF